MSFKTETCPDFTDGSLTVYRKRASFNWKTLKLSIYDEGTVQFLNNIWNFMKNEKLFHPSPATGSLQEIRRNIHKKMLSLKAINCVLSTEMMIQNPNLPAAWIEGLGMYDINSMAKLLINYSMFPGAIKSLGSEKHYKYIEASDNAEINGCFALTEISHGSNAKGMRTTAIYDVENKQFILHSPDFEAAKCWVGCLGQTATHAVVFAKLVTHDGVDRGLHPFIVPIRCTNTLNPFPGIIVGDLGEKIALNGIDHGFVMFNLYRIPKECLLNRLGDVDDDGNYTSPITDPIKRFNAIIGSLLNGRIQIIGLAGIYLQKAVTIAVRYSAVRKQFSPDDASEELAVIEYQQQQFRLIPYIAVVYASKIYFLWFSKMYTLFTIDKFNGVLTFDDITDKTMEIHALSSASKPITAWMARDGIQICREACGGHGYLKAARIGDIRDENDGNCTYEGENSILIQQTSNWILSLRKKSLNGIKIDTPYASANFLNDFDKTFNTKAQLFSLSDAVDPKFLIDCYKWLVCYAIKSTNDKIEKLSSSGLDKFETKNESQSYHAVLLSIVFIEMDILKRFYKTTLEVQDENCKNVLIKLVSLYGAWNLEKHLATLYMGGYFFGNHGILLREGILDLCKALKSEAVTLVDTLAPPDHILNSILGMSDGKVYQHLQSAIFSYPDALSRPDWWKDILNVKSFNISKL